MSIKTIIAAGILATSCGATIKHKTSGETHHYAHVLVEVKASVEVIIEACKQADTPEVCILNTIDDLTEALTKLGENIDQLEDVADQLNEATQPGKLQIPGKKGK